MVYSSKQSTGAVAEHKALLFLKSQGLSLIAQNYRCLLGEIDLVMQDKDDIVFVEVRSRKCVNYGNAFESVDKRKQSKLIKAATHFLQRKGWLFQLNSRFDIIAIHPVAGTMQLEWLKNAFSIESTI